MLDPGAGKKLRIMGRGGVEKQLREGSAWLKTMEGRWSGEGWGHIPLISLLKVGGLHCKEPVLWHEHSGHVVAEAHLRDRL
jgi:hypothetical protein